MLKMSFKALAGVSLMRAASLAGADAGKAASAAGLAVVAASGALGAATAHMAIMSRGGRVRVSLHMRGLRCGLRAPTLATKR